MPKITVMRGLPASGKSTEARRLLVHEGNAIRVNKDDIRAQLFAGLDWSRERERLTVKMQTEMVKVALAENKNVVVDDTNFNDKHVRRWQDIAKKGNHKFELVDVATPVEVCLERDQHRDEKVGRDVILNMAWRAGLIKQEKPWIGCDLDGTLADISKRKTRATRDDGSIDWDKFFNPGYVWLDDPRKDIWEHVRVDAEKNDADIIILSGRSDRTYEVTMQWLEHHGFYNQRLIMRGNQDYRPDDILKLWMLDNYTDASKLIRIYDDRPKVIRAWRARGIEVVDVGDGVEF